MNDYIKILEEKRWSLYYSDGAGYRGEEKELWSVSQGFYREHRILGTGETIKDAIDAALAHDEVKFVFTSEDTFHIKGRGKCFAVRNPIECQNFDHLVGFNVEIDGQVHRVIGVERFAHNAPWRAGEAIALQVAEVDVKEGEAAA